MFTSRWLVVAGLMLITGCGSANSVDSPPAPPAAAAAAAAPAEPLAGTPPPAAPDAPVATLLGKPVRRSDCLSRSSGIGSPEVGIHRLVLAALMDDFCRSRGVRLTPEEIDAFWQTLIAAARRAGNARGEPPAFDKAKVQAQLAEAKAGLASTATPWLERLMLESRVRALEFGLEQESTAALEAYNHLMPLRCQRALYEEYGGKVVGMQISMEPVGAYQRLIEEAEVAGNLKFHDSALERAFRQRLQNDAQRPEIAAERVDFSLPAWLQISLPSPAASAPAASEPASSPAPEPGQAAPEPAAVDRDGE